MIATEARIHANLQRKAGRLPESAEGKEERDAEERVQACKGLAV